MSFCLYRATLGAAGVGSGASKGPLGASGASEGPGLFDPRGSLWSLSLDQSVRALEAWLLCEGQPCPLTEVILI